MTTRLLPPLDEELLLDKEELLTDEETLLDTDEGPMLGKPLLKDEGLHDVLDAGAAPAWHEWTGLDMVFAVWAVRRDVLARHPEAVQAALGALVAARRWGLEHPERVVEVAQATRPRREGYYAAYYETLNFAFDARARSGLARYCDELFALCAIPARVDVEPEVLLVPS